MEKDLRALRRKTGLNQEHFWATVGITQSGGSRYETGRRLPATVEMLLRITYGSDAESKEMIDFLRRRKKTEKTEKTG